MSKRIPPPPPPVFTWEDHLDELRAESRSHDPRAVEAYHTAMTLWIRTGDALTDPWPHVNQEDS